MTEIRIFFRMLVLIMLLAIIGNHVMQSNAAPLIQVEYSNIIDDIVWQEILNSPTRQTTFLVHLTPEGEKAIDAQFRLEKMLKLLQEAGKLMDHQAYYGQNIIKITAGAGVLYLLEDWPELESITAYTPGEDWELATMTPRESIDSGGTSQITGAVIMGDGITPLSGIEVTAYVQTGPTTWSVAGNAVTNTSGDYSISGLEAGIYRVKYEDPSGNYLTEYYNDKSSFNLATNIDVPEGETVGDKDAELASAGKISGTVNLVYGGTEAGLVASAWSNASGLWKKLEIAITDESGGYTLGRLRPGNYRVEFSDSSAYDPPRYITEYYDNVLDIEVAENVPVTAGVTTMDIDADLGSYGSISGNVKDDDGTTNLENIYIDVYRYDSTWKYFASGITDASGNYEVFGLETENVRVGFSDPSGQHVPEFYDGKSNLASADNIAVALGHPTMDINAELMSTSDIVTFAKQTNGEDAEEIPGPYIAVGDSVIWTYGITNNGNDSLTFSIIDNPPVTISCPKYVLLSGESTTCTASGTAVEGQYSNTATVTVMPSGEIPSFDVKDTSHYFGVTTGIDIEKSTNGQDADTTPGPNIKVGNFVNWEYEITNTSNVSLTSIVVTDDQGVIVSCPGDSLDGGASMICIASGIAVEGQYTNLGSVTADPPAGFEQVSDSDYSHYFGIISEMEQVFLPLILR